VTPKEFDCLAKLTHHTSDRAFWRDAIGQLGGRRQDGSWGDDFQIVTDGQRASVDDAFSTDHKGHEGIGAKVGDSGGGLDHASFGFTNHPFPWTAKVRHLWGDEGEVYPEFVAYLFLQLLTEVSGKVIFFDPG
jgi:hypothetical protein